MAGTALRGGLVRLIKPPAEAKKAMNKYGIEIKETKDGNLDLASTIVGLREKLRGLEGVQKSAAISSIFGRTAMAGWAAVVNASEKDFNKLTTAINESEGEAKRIADMKLDTLSGQFTILKSAIDDVRISIGQRLGPMTRSFVEQLTKDMPKVGDSIVNFVSNFINNFEKIKTVLQSVISIIGGVIAGFMAFKALKFISFLIPILSDIVFAIAAFAGGAATLGEALLFALGGPIGTVIAGVALLATAFTLAYQKSDAFRKIVKNIGKSIKNFLQEAVIAISPFISVLGNKLKALGRAIIPLLKVFGDFASTLMSKIGPVFLFLSSNVLAGFILTFTAIVEAVKSAVVAATGVLQGLTSVIKGVFDIVGGIISGDGKQIINGLKSVFKGGIKIVSSIWRGLVDIVTSPIQAVVDILDEKFGKKVEGIKKKWNELKDFLKNPTKAAPKVQPVNLSGEKASNELQASSNGAKAYISSLGQKIGEGIGKIKEKFGELKISATEVFNNIISFVSGKATELKNKLLEGIKPAIDTFKESLSNLKEVFGGSLDSIKEAFRGLKTVFDENIKTPFENLKQKVLETKESLKEVFDNLKSSFADIAKALEPIKDFFSNLFKPIKDDGATKTTKTNMDELKQSTQRVGTSFKELGNAFNQLKEAAKPFIDYLKQIKDSLTSTLGDIGGGLLKGVATSIVLVITSVINAIASIINAVAGAIKGVIDIVKGIFEIIGGIISGDGEKIKQGFSDVLGGIGEVVKSLWEGIKGVLGAPLKAVVNFIDNGFSEKVGQVKQWWSDLKTNVGQKISGFVSFISNGFQQKVQQVGMWWQGLKVKLSGKISGFVSLVENGFKSKVDSIKSAWDSLKKKLSTKITGFVSIVKSGVSNILDHFADGGVASKPSICGEAGPEMVIPLSNSKRSRALSLYKQAGQMLRTKASNNVIPISQKLGTSFNSTSSVQNSTSNIINNIRNFPTRQEEFNNTENRIYQEAQPQNIVSNGSNAINVGGISISIQNADNKEEMIQELLSQVESEIREALQDIG
ncbi:phage tail tape measure protein [Clostridioides sp. ES-W-0016-02]|uniref:phage tail tape measure protein n=1 Tax=Clostridioides sp. ES-W-0016-02 TaxID=2770788 RepID=UPI001D126C85